MAALSAAALFTRFWRLFTPNSVVWDEIYTEKFAGHYLAGTHYFDVHPPLGRLMYAAVARLLGISADTLLAGQPAVSMRVLPAVAGALVVSLVYVICRQLAIARRVAALAAFAVLCDNALLVDSRFMLLESLLMAFGLGSISLYLAARASSGRARIALISGCAFLAGCALSVKWTGASALGVVLAAWLYGTLARRVPLGRAATEAVLLAALPAAVYIASWGVHFRLLTRAGLGEAVMSSQFRATLVGEPGYDPAVHMSLVAKIADVHRAIGAGNHALEHVVNPGSSPWYTWPIMKHPIAMWQDDTHPVTKIILLGNPIVWWGSGIGALACCLLLAWRKERLGAHAFASALLGGAFLLNYVPFMGIRRVMYIYHYLFALVFLVAFAAIAVGQLAGWNDDDGMFWRFPTRASARLYWAVAAMLLAGFLYFSPFTYGWRLSQSAYDVRFRVLHPFP